MNLILDINELSQEEATYKVDMKYNLSGLEWAPY